jgi:hypothetical protein
MLSRLFCYKYSLFTWQRFFITISELNFLNHEKYIICYCSYTRNRVAAWSLCLQRRRFNSHSDSVSGNFIDTWIDQKGIVSYPGDHFEIQLYKFLLSVVNTVSISGYRNYKYQG